MTYTTDLQDNFYSNKQQCARITKRSITIKRKKEMSCITCTQSTTLTWYMLVVIHVLEVLLDLQNKTRGRDIVSSAGSLEDPCADQYGSHTELIVVFRPTRDRLTGIHTDAFTVTTQG
eukprot:scpid56072/ scgid31613/ 